MTTAACQPTIASSASGPVLGVELRCPRCGSVFDRIERSRTGIRNRLRCCSCYFVLRAENDIWLALPPEREAYFQPFTNEYQAVRAAEGRGGSDPQYYLRLPFHDYSGRNQAQWHIRARTFRYIEQKLLPLLESECARRMKILDLGAGNGWLSYRLARVGHFPVAVDLLDDDRDGLGAAQHYLTQLRQEFPRFQAEMDTLPFESGQFDVAIFNASFHYSADYETTLREVMRCLRDAGLAIIADTPFYWRDESGKQMLKERRAVFEKQFGVRCDGLQSGEYLTPVTLDNLAKSLGIQWHVCKPWYGLRWAFRPVKARLLRRREPSKFHLFWFQKG